MILVQYINWQTDFMCMLCCHMILKLPMDVSVAVVEEIFL